MTAETRIRRLVWCYIAVVLSCAVVGMAASWYWRPPASWSITLVLSLLCLLTLRWRVSGMTASAGITASSIVLVAAAAMCGPAGAAIVGLAQWVFEGLRTPAQKWLLNMAQSVLLGISGGAAYVAAGGASDPASLTRPGALLLHLAAPVVLANAVMCLVNAVVLAGVISLSRRVPYREVLIGTLRSGGVAYVGYGLFGLLLVVLWRNAEVGPLAAVLVLAPLYVARWAYSQYAAQNAAHERTVAALVQAVEGKDPYTRGHSERVARACLLIAREVGLSQRRTASLQVAGMLHDVGKLGVPTRVLQKPGPLTDEEFATITRYPARGVEMVREIEFLGEAFDAILHHHERMDGRGYPMGLAGERIPEFARIIAVADAFDAMTSTRPYRPARTQEQALAELRACAGTQFDPRFVVALDEALSRVAWRADEDPAAAGLDSGADPGADPAAFGPHRESVLPGAAS